MGIKGGERNNIKPVIVSSDCWALSRGVRDGQRAKRWIEEECDINCTS
jgi:hypothetical protein